MAASEAAMALLPVTGMMGHWFGSMAASEAAVAMLPFMETLTGFSCFYLISTS